MTQAQALFAPRGDLEAIEGGTAFQPRFDREGLIVAIAVDADSGEVLMVAHMNADALARTIATGEGWFYSRSRQKLWRKGEASGNLLAVREIRVDCDQDAIVLKVTVAGDGVACHRGYRSCFYRVLPVGTKPGDTTLAFDRTMRRSRGDGRPD